jgi:hypothetical protein
MAERAPHDLVAGVSRRLDALSIQTLGRHIRTAKEAGPW